MWKVGSGKEFHEPPQSFPCLHFSHVRQSTSSYIAFKALPAFPAPPLSVSSLSCRHRGVFHFLKCAIVSFTCLSHTRISSENTLSSLLVFKSCINFRFCPDKKCPPATDSRRDKRGARLSGEQSGNVVV